MTLVESLRAAIESGDGSDEYELLVDDVDGVLSVSYAAIFWEQDGWARLFGALATPELADRLGSLVVSGHEEGGVNGTQTWDLWHLLGPEVPFPRLTRLVLPLNGAQDARRIVTFHDMYDADRVFARLLRAAPALQELTASSAPEPGFEQGETHPLRSLRLQSGYASPNAFVECLAGSTRFPELKQLWLTDYAETYMDEWRSQCLTESTVTTLLTSPSLPALRDLRLEGTVLDGDVQQRLVALAASRDRTLQFVPPSEA